MYCIFKLEIFPVSGWNGEYEKGLWRFSTLKINLLRLPTAKTILINVRETDGHHLRPTSFPGLSFCPYSVRVVLREESIVFGFCILPFTRWSLIYSLRPKECDIKLSPDNRTA